MGLQGLDAAAAGRVRPAVDGDGDRRLRQRAAGAVVQRAVAGEADRAVGALDEEGAAGEARIGGGVVEKAVAVVEAAAAVGEAEDDEGGVLAGDRRVQAAEVGGDGGDLAEEEAEGVDDVDAGLADRKRGMVRK